MQAGARSFGIHKGRRYAAHRVLMSFRARLITFFLLIVMVPMIAVGILVLRLIDDSRTGKAQARANGLASAAASVYGQSSRSASYDARTVAKLLESAGDRTLRARALQIDRQVGIARVDGGAGRPDPGRRRRPDRDRARAGGGRRRSRAPDADDHHLRADRRSVRRPAARAGLRRRRASGGRDSGHHRPGSPRAMSCPGSGSSPWDGPPTRW